MTNEKTNSDMFNLFSDGVTLELFFNDIKNCKLYLNIPDFDKCKRTKPNGNTYYMIPCKSLKKIELKLFDDGKELIRTIYKDEKINLYVSNRNFVQSFSFAFSKYKMQTNDKNIMKLGNILLHYTVGFDITFERKTQKLSEVIIEKFYLNGEEQNKINIDDELEEE